MKTTVNKLQADQQLNNKRMMIAIIVMGIILLITSGFLKEETENDTVTPVNKMVTLASIDFCLTPANCYSLEVDKLRQFIFEKNQVCYQLALYSLSEVEEPEMLLSDVAAISEIQEKYFNEKNDQRFVTFENAYLNNLYEAKNQEVFAAIENDYYLNEFLMVENEKDLEIENWMTNENVWEMISNSTNNVDTYLGKMLAVKNKQVYESIRAAELLKEVAAPEAEKALAMESWMTDNTVLASEEFNIPKNQYLATLVREKNEALITSLELQCKCKEFLAMEEKEQPLEMEDWMTDEKCWCPENMKKEHIYTEPYAMKEK